jgi:hypothetical protein
MLKASLSGISATLWVEQIATKYDKTPRAIWKDWQIRDTWIKDHIHIGEIEEQRGKLLNEFELIRQASWETYGRAQNEATKTAALNTLKDLTVKQIESMQSMGLIEKRTDPIAEINVTQNQAQLDVKITEQSFETLLGNLGDVIQDETLRRTLRDDRKGIGSDIQESVHDPQA